MAYQVDSLGNYFVGTLDPQVGWSYYYPTLSNTSAGTIKADIQAIAGLLNFKFINFASTWTDGIALTFSNLITFKLAGDSNITAIKRGQIDTIPNNINAYQDNGTTSANNISLNSFTNSISYCINAKGILTMTYRTDNLTTPTIGMSYIGELENINTTLNYYSNTYLNKFVTFGVRATIFQGQHTIQQTATFNKPILLTGDAVYSIVCNDGQTAGSDLWCTKLHLFDNDSVKGFPRIGTIPNVLIGIGTSWVIGNIYVLNTAVDAGRNEWVCVGKWNNLSNRFVLTRCWRT